MAIAYVSAASGSNNTSCPKPANVVAGNLLVAYVIVYDNGSATLTPPSGWTQTRVDRHTGSDITSVFQLEKIATASEPTSYSFTNSQSAYTDIAILQYSGTDPTTPHDTDAGANGSSSTRSIAGATLTNANEMVALGSAGFNNGPSAAPSGFTQRVLWDSVNAAYDQLYAAAGATGTISQSQSGSDSWVLSLDAIQPPVAGGGTSHPQTLTVAQSATPSFAKQIGKPLTIAQSSAPLLVKQMAKAFAVAQATTAGMARRVGKMLSTAQAGVPGFAAARLRVALLSVAQSSAATLTKQIGKPLSVAQTSAATVGRLIGKVLTVAQATMATLSAARGAQLRAVTLTVAQAAAPLMARSIGKIVGVGQVTTPLLTKQAVKALSVAQGAVVTLQTIKARFITLAVAQAASPIMARAIGKALTAPQATVSLVARRIGKTLVTGQATSALLPVIKARFITLTVAQASVASMARSVGKTLSVAQGTTTLMARAIARVLAITQAATPTLLAARVRVAALSVTQASAVALGTLRARFVVLAVTQAANTALSRAIAKTLSAVQGQAVALPKRIAKTMAVTQATTALLTTLKNAITPVIGVWAAFRSVVAALHFAAVVPALSFQSAEGRDMPMIPVDAGTGEYVLRTTDRNRLFTCDFSGNPNLGPNESIASATVVVKTWAAGAWPGATETDATAAVVVGASASPATAQVAGNVVSVLLGPGAVKGNQYRVYVQATTNAGQVITDYSPTIECDI